MAEELIKYHVLRFEALRSDRYNFDNQWEEAALRLLPAHRNTFQWYGANAIQQGQKNTEQMFDANAALALQRFSAVMESLSTPQGAMWHRLVPANKRLRRDKRIRMWFDEVNELLFAYRYSKNAGFVGSSQSELMSVGAYGNGTLFVDQPEDRPGLRYRNVHIGDAWFAENHAGRVDTIYRILKLTARQAVQEYGEGNLPVPIADASKQPGRENEKFEFLQCVYPRTDWSPYRIDALGMRFASLHIALNDKKVVREGGYNTLPFIVDRYTRNGDSNFF